jgi:hypothetical protein
VTGYLYRFDAWFRHLFMVCFEVQVDVWYMLAQVISRGCYKLITVLFVEVYNSISHSDSVAMVPSFYFYIRAVGRGKGWWL